MKKFKIEPGFIYGEKLEAVWDFCKSAECALPAVNVSSSNTINAALAAAAQVGAPIIVQLSYAGSAAFAGHSLNNDDHQASILGAASMAMYLKSLALAYGVPVVIHTDHCPKERLGWVDGLLEIGADYYEAYGEPLFSSHMLDLSLEPVLENIKTSAKYLKKIAALEMMLEIEIGLTGGEEDGINNTAAPREQLYSRPEDVAKAFQTLSSLGHLNIAAAFGNVHGVYLNKSAKLRPTILDDCQKFVREKLKINHPEKKPLNLVFHGGSGTKPSKIKEVIGYGVVKFNIDTDAQWAFTKPIKKYMTKFDNYLQSQVGNQEGKNLPNKKYYDPRSWLVAGEQGMTRKLEEMFGLLNSANKFEILD